MAKLNSFDSARKLGAAHGVQPAKHGDMYSTRTARRALLAA